MVEPSVRAEYNVFVIATSGGGAAGIGAGVVVLLLVVPYFIPTIVGVIRKVPNIGSVIVVNLLLGWTLIGWVVALAMAARSVPPGPTQIHIQQQQWPPGATPSPPGGPPPPPPPPP